MPYNKQTLFLQTYRYPYMPEEHFIESEIGHLAEAFDRVLVYPDRTQWWKSDQPPRAMPDGVECCNIGDAPLYLRAWWIVLGLIKAVFVVLKYRSVWPGSAETEAASLCKSFISSLKMMAAKPAILWFFKQKGVVSPVGYGYWRHGAVGALGLLKQDGVIEQLHVRCHRCDIYFPERHPFEVILHQTADGVYPVSTDGKEYLVQVKGLPADSIEVQRLGVDLPKQLSCPSSDGILRIVSCSNIIPVKRVTFIAEVIRALKIPCEWTHIGDGPGRGAVNAIVETFGTDANAQFLGRIPNAEVLKYYLTKPVDLFINLSESEGVPVSIMEALAHGIPVVATDVGGSAEVIDGVNGRIVVIDASVDLVVESIQALLEDSTRARSAAREMAENRCSSVANYRVFCELLKGE